MTLEHRADLIRQIEKLRGSKVLTYVTSDRAPIAAQIGDDAVRPMYDHLRNLGHIDQLDLLVYSRGGAIDVPWRVVTALRQTSDRWAMLVPFRANSAATLMAIGADEIVLGRQGELGPIDPQMMLRRPVNQPGGGQTFVNEQVSLEDVMAYTKFIRETAGLTDQEALATALSKLTERLDAVLLGNIYRTHLHIRDVARRMLLSRAEPGSEQTIGTIIETLAERVYAHGHAIGRKEAADIGLPVKAAADDLDEAMWALLNEYETDLKLLEPIDPASAVKQTDVYTEPAVVAVIESDWGSHQFTGDIEIRARRQVPANLSVNLQLNLQMPAGMNVGQIPGNAQAVLQQMIQGAQQQLIGQAQQAVQQAMQQQAPVVGLETALRNGRWTKAR